MKTSLSTLGEFGLISRIAAGITAGVGVVTGIGDDAAVMQTTPGMQLLTSTDMLLEDVHFRRSWHDPYRLGRKSLAVNISDIAAMGAVPRWATLSLAIPSDLSLDFLDEFTRGFLSMADEHGVTLVGGDTCKSVSALVISVTIMGEQYPDRILRRSGARPDDDIWVTGTLGDAALGLKLLEKENLPHPPPDLPLEGGGTKSSKSEPTSEVRAVFDQPPFQGICTNLSQKTLDIPTPLQGAGRGEDGVDFFISRLLDPTPRVFAGLALAEAGLVTSMIDISDGILGDFGHIADQSAVGGTIYIEQLPLSRHYVSLSQTLTTDPYLLPLSGGEDYELCFTASPMNREKIVECMKKSGIEATPVGIVTPLPGVRPVHADGTLYIRQLSGFKHFT